MINTSMSLCVFSLLTSDAVNYSRHKQCFNPSCNLYKIGNFETQSQKQITVVDSWYCIAKNSLQPVFHIKFPHHVNGFQLHAWNSNLIALICGSKYKNYITLGISRSTYIHYSLESSELELADSIKLLSFYYMPYINMEPFP